VQTVIEFNFVKIIPQSGATRDTMFKVTRWNIQIAIFRSNFVQNFNTSLAIHDKCSRTKVIMSQSQGHIYRVRGQGHSAKWGINSENAV